MTNKSDLDIILSHLANDKNTLDLNISFKGLNKEQLEIAQEVVRSDIFGSEIYSTLDGVKFVYKTFYMGGMDELIHIFGDSGFLKNLIINEDGRDIITKSNSCKIFELDCSLSDYDLRTKLLSNTGLASMLNLGNKPFRGVTPFEAYVYNLVYSHRMYKLIMHQHSYPNKRNAKVSFVNGCMKIQYHDVSKFDVGQYFRNLEKEVADHKYSISQDVNIGGALALVQDFPTISSDYNLEYTQLDDELSEISINLGLPADYFQEFNLTLSILNMFAFIRTLDKVLIQFPFILNGKFLCEEVINNLIYHNFNVPLNTKISVYSDGIYEFSLLNSNEE